MVVFGLKLAVEPTGEIADRLNHGLLGIRGGRLPAWAVAGDVHGHGVFVIIAAAVADRGGKLVEVAPLYGLMPVGDAVQSRVLGNLVPDTRGRALGVADVCFKTGPIPLAPES